MRTAQQIQTGLSILNAKAALVRIRLRQCVEEMHGTRTITLCLSSVCQHLQTHPSSRPYLLK